MRSMLVINGFVYAGMLVMFYRQIQKRIVRYRRGRLTVVLTLGSAYLAGYAYRHPISLHDALLLTASFTVLGVGMGVLRAYTIALWREGFVMYRKGTAVTAALWIIAVGLHITADHFAQAGSASLPLYLGVTMAVQRQVILRRVPAMDTESSAVPPAQ